MQHLDPNSYLHPKNPDALAQARQIAHWCFDRVGALPAMKERRLEKISIVWGRPSMTRTMGWAQYESKRFPHGEIRLSPHLYARVGEAKRRNVVIHEMCHLLADWLYGHKGHRAPWKNLMIQCGEDPIRCWSPRELLS